VHLTSTVGVGTRVEIVLPRAIADTGHAGAEAANAGAATIAGQGETILVVEDDTLLRQTVASALEDYGYTVIATEHGAAAMAALQSGQHIDLLFTDVMMPGTLNGVQLAQAARACRPNLKVMFATGYSDRKVLAQWPETLDLIAKPYALGDVALRIARRLGAREAAEG